MVKPTILTGHGCVYFAGGMVIDGDGAPNCYAPAGHGLRPLDYLANAGNDRDGWYGLVTIGGEPVIQQSGPTAGYYLSPTALQDRSKVITDPTRYVDSTQVPYVSIPPDLRAYGVELGDVAIVSYRGVDCACVVADVSPRGHFGEASIACAIALGMPSSPKNGGVASGVGYYLFPGSALCPAWPRDMEEVKTTTATLIKAWRAAGTA